MFLVMEHIFSKSSILFLILVLSFVLYHLSIALKRVYFSPLSHIPGPKIAIATSWYECYFDVWNRGVYYKKVKEFHKKYGPIIRINPHEVHIEDSEYYDELYNSNYRWNKYWLYVNQFNTPGAVISTIEHDVHRARRKPESNFFSKRSVVALEPMIHRNLDKLCVRMQQFRDSKIVFPMNAAMLCLTSDVVSEYAFGTSYNLLETDDFSPSMLAANKKTGEYSHALKQFPWLVHVFNLLSQKWIARLSSDFGLILGYQDIARQHVLKIRSSTDTDAKHVHSIFHTLIDSDLSASDKETERLAKEGFVIVAAGGDTTGATISLILFHLIDNPAKLSRLRTELAPLFAKTSPPVTWTQLEQLRYMNAVINEGLRKDYGVTSRLPRCAPDRDTKYRDIVIPRGTPVSMSIPDIHDDPKIFPQPSKFLPERWLRDERAEGMPDPAGLQRFLVPFSKGTRQCLGLNLAYAEIYLTIATLVMQFDFELYETTRDDVDFHHDFTLPHPRLDSRYIRVLVK